MGRWHFRHVVNKQCTIEVTADEDGIRLDRWLALRVPLLGRKRAKRWCEAGCVLVNGRVGIKSLVLSAGQQVRLPLPAPRSAVPNASLTLDIRFENEFLAVVCKPALQATAPLDGDDHSALANALLAHYPSIQGVGPNPLEPGLIHRLDNGTSGLLVVARVTPAFDALRLALSMGQIDKEYLAIVQGVDLPDRGCIELPLRKSPRNARRVVVAEPSSPGARVAKTDFQILERSGEFSVVKVQASRALRHQIRAHLSSLGYPLVNDELYGATKQASLAPGRHALHARRVAWAGNGTMPAFDVVAPVPLDLLGLLRGLGFRTSLSL